MSTSSLARGIIGDDDIARARDAALRAGSKIAPEPTWHNAVIALARPVGDYLTEDGITAAEFVRRMVAAERALHNLTSESMKKNVRTGNIEPFMDSVRAYRDYMAGEG